MGIVSMTGFGRVRCASKGVCVDVELSSVNRRQFDVRVTLPRSLAAHEPRLAALIHKVIERGAVSGAVKVSVSGTLRRRGAGIDAEMAAAYVAALRKTAMRLGLRDDLGVHSLIKLPEVVRYEDVAENSDAVWKLVERAVKASLTRLAGMRREEGRALERDLTRRLSSAQRLLERISKRGPFVTRRYLISLQSRLAAAGVRLEAHDPQLAKELALFADRSNISEEVIRLGSHFKQAAKLMKAAEPAGRSLDFLCQEMFREINTIGSKANDAEISRLVVRFKTELECIREQVQNVE